MQLFYSPTSPYVRKVMVVAHEVGLVDRIERSIRHPNPIDRDSSIVARNPAGKVPAMVLDDGSVLYDSRVICRYLDSLHSGPRLYPAEGQERWRVLTLEAAADGLLDAALLLYYETYERPKELRWDPWIAGQWEKIESTVDEYERNVATELDGQWNAGAIAVACTLGYLDFRFAERPWRGGRPGITAWYEAAARRPAMEATVPRVPAGSE